MTKKIWMAIVFYFASLSFVFSIGWTSGRKDLRENWMFGFDFELYNPGDRVCTLSSGVKYRVEGWYGTEKNPKLSIFVNRAEGKFVERHKWPARRVYGYFFDSEAWAKQFFGEKK